MKHTYLFEPAVWEVAGTFWRADGEAHEAIGRTEIAHRPECWLLSGKLKVLSTPSVEFVHAYWMEPPGLHGGSVRWTFENEMFGKLQGRYTTIGPSIMSVYACETSGYHGAEHLAQLDPDNYRSAGMLLLKDRIMYSWQMMLKRGG